MDKTKLISSRDYGYIESDWLDFLNQIKRKQDRIPQNDLKEIVKGISIINRALTKTREKAIKNDICKLEKKLE